MLIPIKQIILESRSKAVKERLDKEYKKIKKHKNVITYNALSSGIGSIAGAKLISAIDDGNILESSFTRDVKNMALKDARFIGKIGKGVADGAVYIGNGLYRGTKGTVRLAADGTAKLIRVTPDNVKSVARIGTGAYLAKAGYDQANAYLEDN